MYKGGCLCGRVQYEISGPIRNIIYCHCSQCRKAQGSAFATNGIVDSKHFKIVTGEEQLTGYESTPGQTKYFCSHCGSPYHQQISHQIRSGQGTYWDNRN